MNKDIIGIFQGYVGLVVIVLIMILELDLLMDIMVLFGCGLLFVGFMFYGYNGRSKKF